MFSHNNCFLSSQYANIFSTLDVAYGLFGSKHNMDIRVSVANNCHQAVFD